jgi:3-oxoacyl-[acyl-carrier protein] reductase
MASLNGKVALVTGASGGIGRATAVELGRLGASVAAHYFSKKDGADETAVALRELGTNADVIQADLRKLDDVVDLIATVERRFERIDVLVNNAGDLVERRSLLEMTDAIWRDVLDRNLTSTFYCCQAAVPGMMKRRQGAIVNLSSLAAHNGGGPGAFAYAASKGAIVSLTKALAKELAPHGIRVNCVAPGLIGDTAFHQRFTPRETFESMAKNVPLGRAGTPEEVAKAIAFLATDDSAYLTGETIEINGGLLMR